MANLELVGHGIVGATNYVVVFVRSVSRMCEVCAKKCEKVAHVVVFPQNVGLQYHVVV